MFTIDLADELKGRCDRQCPPSSTYMNTTMVAQAGVSPISKCEAGAAALRKLAVSAALEGRSGLYFNVLSEARANPQAYDAQARRRLRALSGELTGLRL